MTQKTIFFLQNVWILPTSEALEVKTMYTREFITQFKGVHNVISGNFHFDNNTVLSNLKKTVSDLKKS